MALTAEALRHYGVHLSPRAMEELLLRTLAEMAPPAVLPDPRVELSPDELAALESGGFTLAMPERGGPDDPLARTAALYTALLAGSFTISEVAAMLGVTSGRIRQLLAERAIYGIKRGHTWRLPRFQLDGHHLIPGIGPVIAALDPDLHPVEVYQWFTTPDPDLVSADGDIPLSPREWLVSGYPIQPAVQLAADLTSGQ